MTTKETTEIKKQFKVLDSIFYENKGIHLQPSLHEAIIPYFQKRMGWLYIMKNADHDFLKIGRTTKEPMKRQKSLSTTGVFSDYEVVFALPSYNQVITETLLFHKLKSHRVKGEFFSCNTDLAIQAMIKVLEEEKKNLAPYFDLDMFDYNKDMIEHSFLKK